MSAAVRTAGLNRSSNPHINTEPPVRDRTDDLRDVRAMVSAIGFSTSKRQTHLDHRHRMPVVELRGSCDHHGVDARELGLRDPPALETLRRGAAHRLGRDRRSTRARLRAEPASTRACSEPIEPAPMRPTRSTISAPPGGSSWWSRCGRAHPRRDAGEPAATGTDATHPLPPASR